MFGGERGLYTRLTGRQNLEYWGALYKLPPHEVKARSSALLDRMGPTDRAEQRVEEVLGRNEAGYASPAG